MLAFNYSLIFVFRSGQTSVNVHTGMHLVAEVQLINVMRIPVDRYVAMEAGGRVISLSRLTPAARVQLPVRALSRMTHPSIPSGSVN